MLVNVLQSQRLLAGFPGKSLDFLEFAFVDKPMVDLMIGGPR